MRTNELTTEPDKRARWVISLVGLLWLMAACGGPGPAGTPNATGTAIRAATEIASLPTAAPLTPQPTRTPAPSATVALPTNTPAPAATEAPTDEYTVQAGDTLLSIAFAHNVSMAAIMLLNDMGDTQVVKLGQILKIPIAPLWPGENVFWFVYIVQPGEALSSIAARYAVKIDDLVRLNQLADAGAIRIGQALVIPAQAPAAHPEPSQAPAPTATARSHAEAVPQDTPQDTAPAAAREDVPAPQAAGDAVASVAGNGDIESLRAQVLALYNQARAVAGLPPLGAAGTLQQAAQSHAEDCAQRGFGSHVGSDGADTRARIARAGYAGRTWGENWAWGLSAQQVFDAWFNQESDDGPHRRNILSPRYTEVGFGIAAASGGYYFIADFGAP